MYSRSMAELWLALEHWLLPVPRSTSLLSLHITYTYLFSLCKRDYIFLPPSFTSSTYQPTERLDRNSSNSYATSCFSRLELWYLWGRKVAHCWYLQYLLAPGRKWLFIRSFTPPSFNCARTEHFLFCCCHNLPMQKVSINQASGRNIKCHTFAVASNWFVAQENTWQHIEIKLLLNSQPHG